MVNSEGEFVVAEPDKASWEQYQAKTKVATVAHEVAELNSQELQDRGLMCPIDNKLFIDPTKTPCCKRTYCNDCITNSLIENDLKCPGCQKEGVLIDDLVADEETAAKVKAYLGEKDKEKAEERHREREKSKSPDNQPAKNSTPSSPSSKGQPRRLGSSPKAEAKSGPAPIPNGISKKRPAEEELPNPRAPQVPKTEAAKTPQPDQQAQPPTAPAKNQAPLQQTFPNGQYGLPGQSFNGALGQIGVTGAAIPNFAGMPIGIGAMGGMDPNMLAYAGMNGYGGMMNGYPNAGGVGFMQQQQQRQQQPPASMYDGTFNDSNMMMLMMNGGFTPYAPNMLMMMNGAMPGGMVAETNGNTHGSINGMFQAQSMPVPPYSGRQSQQRRNGGFHDTAPPDNDDDAYFRKPVNPHRHQARQRRARPSDYREL
jgi:protein MPE1